MFTYYSLAVQRLFHTSRYYLAVNSKSSVCPVLLSVCLCTIHRVRRIVCKCMSGGPPPYVRITNNNVHPMFLHKSALKDKSIHPRTLAYVQSKSLISSKCLSGRS